MHLQQSVSEDESLLALRRTLWQLALVGLGAAIAIDRFATGAGIPALWCLLVPLSALAVHFRFELRELWAARHDGGGRRVHARRGGSQRSARRRSGMAARRSRPTELAGAR